ncbi:MAG: phosphatase PAP2 family protein [Eubacterium sp.]|nr:phosphatase PAP2 family protein [Eubacterium sp.]
MKTKMKFILSCVCFLLFIGLIVMIKKVGVAAIGPEGTEIGMAGINQDFHQSAGLNMGWYKLTEYLGYASLALVGVFALAGLVQLVKRKSLLKVDRTILALGGLYVVVLGLYVAFDKIAINYRPEILEGETHVEPSFPSSHTMLACVVLGSAALVMRQYISNRTLATALQVIAVAVCVVLVVGRLLSGVHWLTDIIGGVLISLALLLLFSGIRDMLGEGAAREAA